MYLTDRLNYLHIKRIQSNHKNRQWSTVTFWSIMIKNTLIEFILTLTVKYFVLNFVHLCLELVPVAWLIWRFPFSLYLLNISSGSNYRSQRVGQLGTSFRITSERKPCFDMNASRYEFLCDLNFSRCFSVPKVFVRTVNVSHCISKGIFVMVSIYIYGV